MARSKQQSGFTTAQDMSLLAAVKQFDKKWIIVQNRVTGKSAKECEDRYKELEATGIVQETNQIKSLTGTKRSVVSNDLKAIPELPKINNVESNIRITKPVSKALESRRIPTTERKIAPRLQSSNRTFGPISQLPILLPKPKPSEISGSTRISSIKTNTKKSSKKKALTSPFKPRPQSQFPATSPLKAWPELQNPNQFLNFNIFDSNMPLVTPKVGIDENSPITMEKLYQSIEFPPAPQQDKPRAKTYTTPIKVPAQTQNFDELFGVNDSADAHAYSGRLDHALIPAIQLENSKIFSKSDLDLDEFVLAPKRKKGIPDLTSDNFFDDDLVGDEYLDAFLYVADNNDKDDESEVEEDITRDEVNDLFLESVEESKISEELAGVCGLQNVNWVKNNEGGFSHEQITELKLQLKQTFQLIVQNFVIDKADIGMLRTNGISLTGHMSIFNIPGAEQIPHLLNRTYLRDAEFTKNYKIQRSPYANPLELLPVFEEVLKPLEPHFESSLVPNIRPKKRKLRKDFKKQEDNLLFQGLIQFGFSDLITIKFHYLPTKTLDIIWNHLMDLKSRIYPKNSSNPIKNLALLPFKPMTVNEKHILRQGILKFGHAFCSTFGYLFSYIPNPLLRLAWNELYQIGAVPIPWVEPDKAAPVKKLEGTKEKENSISEQQLPLSDVVGLNIDSLFSADPNRGGENLVDFFGDDVLGDLDHVSSNNYDPPSIFSCNFEDDFLNSPLLSRIAVENVKDGDHCNPFFEFDDERNQTPARSINTPIKTSPSVNTTPRSQPDHRARRKKKSNPTQKVVGRSHTPIKKKPTRLLREMQVNNPRSDAESLVSESPVGSHYRLDSNGIFQDEGTPSCNSFEADAEAVMLVRRKKSTPKKLTPNPGPNKQIHTPIRKFKITKRERSSSQNKRTPKKIKFQKDKSPKHVPSVQFANLYGLSSTDDDYEPVTEPHAKVENMIMESNEVLPLGKNGQGKLRKLPTRLASDSIQGPGNLAAKVLKHRRSFAHNTLSL